MGASEAHGLLVVDGWSVRVVTGQGEVDGLAAFAADGRLGGEDGGAGVLPLAGAAVIHIPPRYAKRPAPCVGNGPHTWGQIPHETVGLGSPIDAAPRCNPHSATGTAVPSPSGRDVGVGLVVLVPLGAVRLGTLPCSGL